MNSIDESSYDLSHRFLAGNPEVQCINDTHLSVDAAQLPNPCGLDGGCIQEIFVVARPGFKDIAKAGFSLQEVSGALGDIGTFLPLTVNLAATGGKDR